MNHSHRLERAVALALTLLALPIAANAADSDADGVPDPADNCIEVSNADQRDTDADGFGNRCDADLDNNLIVNFLDVAEFKKVFLTKAGDANFDPDADFDGNGIINFQDLTVVRSGFFEAPGPAGNEVDPDPGIGELDVDTLATPQPLCGDLTHHLSVAWTVLEPQGGVSVDIMIMLPDGHVDTRHANVPTGSVIFDVDSPFGGPVTVLTKASDRSGMEGSDTLVAELPPCDDNPPPDPPDLGFTNPPAEDPPIIGVPDSPPNEVDIVHLGGSPHGPTRTKIVAAAGTGSGVKLYSYDVDLVTWAPIFLKEAGPFAGRDVRLEVLSPEITPKLAVQPFVAGVIGTDGNLWLTTWQVFSDGAMMDFSTVGYGENAHLHVEAYDIAHVQLDDGDYQVVTPVRTSNNKLRTITWEIDSATGKLTGRADSGDWGDPAPDAQPSIEHLNDGLYVVTYRNSAGRMATRYWQVSQGGTPTDAYGAVSGLDHEGDDTVIELITQTVNLPIATDGFLTPIVGTQSSMRLDTWETRLHYWGEGGISYMPYLVSDSSQDNSPAGFGVDIPQPSVTDAEDSNGAFLMGVRALLTDGLIENDFGVGAGELFLEMPAGELTSVHSASVTKNMTLLIAVEAVQAGEVSLDDPVTISQAAADVGGSSMGLLEGEVQSLENLIYGMMLKSGNDASAAIAEHISGPGAFDTFVARMNQRASQLGLDDTTYNVPSDPAGGPANSVITTPQDQVTLWLYASENPMFLEFASRTMYDACGVDAEGDEVCHFLDKGSVDYPGVVAWKNGNGGHFIPGYSDAGGPYCVDSGCLVAHATRLDRDMVVGIQNSGNRWADAKALWEYGYRKQFTPDRRGPTQSHANVTDFAIDAVQDTLGVHAEIDTGGDFSVCTWALSADGGSIMLIGCHGPVFSGVAGGINRTPATLVDGVRISTLLADGDYWTGYRSGSTLSLNLWRVGPKE